MTARRGSILFFSTIFLMMFYVFYVVITQDVRHVEYARYWWIILLPFAISKAFFKNSRLTRWMETRIKLF